MSFAKYAQFYKDNGFFAGSKIKTTVTDGTFVGEQLVLSKGNTILKTTTIPTSGKVEFFTDESGELLLSADNGTSTLSGSVTITSYATYNVTLHGTASDTTRDIYIDKNNIVFNEDVTSETVNVAYTGDPSALSIKSTNPNIAKAVLDDNRITISDAGMGFKGAADVIVTVQETESYQKKTASIHVTKTNGVIDKTWAGLKNIVENEQESELCEVGEEFPITLSNGRTMIYIIGAINHDYDHQIIFVPKRYDYLDKDANQRGTTPLNYYDTGTLCEYLNGTFFDMLPSDMRNVISEKTVQYATANNRLVSYTKKIWLPREYEILGKTHVSYSKESEIYRIHQLECFEKDLVTLYVTNSIGTSGEGIFSCSPASSGSGNMCIAYRYSNTLTYETSYISGANYSRPFPCFHIIKET